MKPEYVYLLYPPNDCGVFPYIFSTYEEAVLRFDDTVREIKANFLAEESKFIYPLPEPLAKELIQQKREVKAWLEEDVSLEYPQELAFDRAIIRRARIQPAYGPLKTLCLYRVPIEETLERE